MHVAEEVRAGLRADQSVADRLEDLAFRIMDRFERGRFLTLTSQPLDIRPRRVHELQKLEAAGGNFLVPLLLPRLPLGLHRPVIEHGRHVDGEIRRQARFHLRPKRADLALDLQRAHVRMLGRDIEHGAVDAATDAGGITLLARPLVCILCSVRSEARWIAGPIPPQDHRSGRSRSPRTVRCRWPAWPRPWPHSPGSKNATCPAAAAAVSTIRARGQQVGPLALDAAMSTGIAATARPNHALQVEGRHQRPLAVRPETGTDETGDCWRLGGSWRALAMRRPADTIVATSRF